MPAQKPKKAEKGPAGKNGQARQKPLKDIRESAVEAALDIAADGGWTACDFPAIAARAGIAPEDLRLHFEDKADILSAYGRMIDRRVFDALPPDDGGGAPRDRLFDLLMERFDMLNERRAAVTAILSSFRCDPKQAVTGLPHLGRSMGRTLEAAGIPAGGIGGALRIAGLTGVYLKTLRTWREDDSPDLALTMAALDRNLQRAEQAAAFLRLDRAGD